MPDETKTESPTKPSSKKPKSVAASREYKPYAEEEFKSGNITPEEIIKRGTAALGRAKDQ
jgi:hypothetical protein